MSHRACATVKLSAVLLILLLLSACATVKKAPLTGIVPGREVETLQSAISISVKSGEHSTSGRGYLIFKEPDRFHMAVLSPFGLTVLEVFLDHERLTCLVPSRQAAYTGLVSELPAGSALQSMSMMKWVVAKAPAPEPGAREITSPDGGRFYFGDFGLVQRKVSPEGDQVQYRDYHNVDGVAFPSSLLIQNAYGASVKIVFDDPQINQPVEDSALQPNLEEYTVLPLADFKGI